MPTPVPKAAHSAAPLATFEQISRFYSKRVRYSGKNQYARVAFPALNSARICKVDSSLEGELLLRQPRPGASLPDVLPDDDPPISHGP